MPTQKLHDRWFRLIGLPLIALAGHVIFYNRNDSGGEVFGFWGIYLLSLAETLVIWESNRLVLLFFRRRYPGVGQTTPRIAAVLLVCTPLTIVVRTLNIALYDVTQLWGYQFPLEAYLQNIFVAILFVVVVGGIYEAFYYFRMWKDMVVETEALKKENLQTQLDLLKTQISPHFLFNSLGSLSSLIEEAPQKAQQFVGEMSSVYRYLLQANEKELIPLQQELDFVTAYFNMLVTRFPEGLQLRTDIDPTCLDYLLPPLTLQLLVENAVKHNVVLPTKPLMVHVYTNNTQHLIVSNNLQKKSAPMQSHRQGLRNIATKYKLMNQPEVVVKKTATHFQVTIPLIKSKSHARADC